MNKDLNTIVDLYGSQGHVFADVQADPRFLDEPGTLDLVYRIKEGEVFRVGEINVHIGGEYPHTQQTVVLNRLSLRYGDLIDTREIRNSERRLKASQLFEVDPQQGDPPRVVVRPPDLSTVGSIAEQPRPASTIRGQSPEQPTCRDLPLRRRNSRSARSKSSRGSNFGRTDFQSVKRLDGVQLRPTRDTRKPALTRLATFATPRRPDSRRIRPGRMLRAVLRLVRRRRLWR